MSEKLWVLTCTPTKKERKIKWWILWVLIGLIGLLLLIRLIGASSYFDQILQDTNQTIEYTPSTINTCSNGLCNLVLYSGLMFYDNGTGYKEIDTSLVPYGLDGYDYHLNYSAYDFRVKLNSNWGDGIKYCVKDGEEYCLIYQSSDMSYRNQYGSQDYISNVLGVTGIIQDYKITYPNLYPKTNLTLIASNEMLKELYTISEKPRTPATYLGNNVTLDFGGYVKFGSLDVWANGIKQTGNSFKTSGKVEFRNGNKTLFYLPEPIAYDKLNNFIDCEYEVKISGNQIWFYVRTPYSWINDTSRVYPIYIDPTIILQNTSNPVGNIKDAKVSSYLPNNNYATDTGLDIYYYPLPNATFRSYIQFNTTLIPEDSYIDYASINLYGNIVFTDEDSSQNNISVYNLFGDWVSSVDSSNLSEYQITWNNQPCGINFDNTTNCNLSYFHNSSIIVNGWNSIEITDFIEPSSNISSFAFRLQNETTTHTGRVGMIAYSREENNAPPLKPYLNISYNVNPTLKLNSPLNNSLQKSNVLFNCSGESLSVNLSRMDLVIFNSDNSLNYSDFKNLTGLSDSVNWSLNFSSGNYSWNCILLDSIGRYVFNESNFIFQVDSDSPSITINNISTTGGSQTFNFNSTANDTNLDTCKYSIYFNGSIDGISENVSFDCNTLKTASATKYGTFTLRVYANDTAGNENYTESSFTLSQLVVGSGGGGGFDTIINYRPAENFSIVTQNYGNVLDFSLAKDSVKSRTKYFYAINDGLEEVNLTFKCDTQNVNESTRNVSICDYVEFPNSSVIVQPNSLNPEIIQVKVLTPENSSLGDKYYFNILATTMEGSTIEFSKLSVSTSVTFFGQVTKWSYLPSATEDKTSYPVWTLALFFAVLFFGLVYWIFTKLKSETLGFFLSILVSILVFFITMEVL